MSIIASLALFGAAVSAATSSLPVGSATVVNSCSYDVYLHSVPAAGGGQVEQDQVLSSGESWSNVWTSLTNGDGWSIKLSKSTSLASILQYEYTFHNDGIIWFDLSAVNGDPWSDNWEISSDNGCDPKQTAYRYPTDDDYGMQSCAQDATVTVTLCSSEGGNSTSGGAAPSYSAAAPSSTSAPGNVVESVGVALSSVFEGKHAATAVPATPTTFATSAAAVTHAPNVVMEIDTDVVTEVVTAFAGRHVKPRHEHHAHAHQHNA